MKNFLGNQTHNDHFKLLQSDGVSLLIGARNVVYNLSLARLEENVESVSNSNSCPTVPGRQFLGRRRESLTRCVAVN